MQEDPCTSESLTFSVLMNLVIEICITCSLVVSIADERDSELYTLSPDVLKTAIPSMLALKVQ